MESIIKFVVESGTFGYAIVLTGIASLAIIIERVKTLYYDFNLKTESFMAQLNSLLLSDKIEESVTFCEANKDKPVAHIIKSVLERADRDEESMKKSFEISFTEVLPKVVKRLGFLAMLANVATLIGLLGTIQGLILAFQAVAHADPSQKQTLLAEGISVAMNTTAMGLSVAIPVLVVQSLLSSKKDSILTDCAENGSRVLDLLTSRVYREDSSSSKAA